MVGESFRSVAYKCASTAFGQVLSYKPFYQVLALCLEEYLDPQFLEFSPRHSGPLLVGF